MIPIVASSHGQYANVALLRPLQRSAIRRCIGNSITDVLMHRDCVIRQQQQQQEQKQQDSHDQHDHRSEPDCIHGVAVNPLFLSCRPNKLSSVATFSTTASPYFARTPSDEGRIETADKTRLKMAYEDIGEMNNNKRRGDENGRGMKEKNVKKGGAIVKRFQKQNHQHNDRTVSTNSSTSQPAIVKEGQDKRSRQPWGQQTTMQRRKRVVSSRNVQMTNPQQEDSTQAEQVKSPAKQQGVLTLRQSTQRMSELLERRNRFPPLSSIMLPGSSSISMRGNDDDDDDLVVERSTLFVDTVGLIATVKKSIENGHIQASGKDIHALSDLLGNALIIYSESPPILQYMPAGRNENSISTTTFWENAKTIPSPYEACMDILNTLYELNLDMQPINYACAIRAACHEARWAEAADLFLVQIDPDAAGLAPMDATLGWDGPVEMGLYAIARSAQQEQQQQQQEQEQLHGGDGASTASSSGASVAVERVFDAALSMCIVSPADQEKYILAAGSALGRAGEWKACINFQKTSYHSTRLGQSLVAAVMLACIRSSQYDAALDVYRDLLEGPLLAGGEWQWGGGTHSLHPLCRDLALCAMGKCTQTGLTAEAVKIFDDILEERAPVSVEAVRGLLMSCERDGDWENALNVLSLMLDESDNPRLYLVEDSLDAALDESAASLQNVENSAVEGKHGLNDGKLLALDVDMLSSFMRTCNASGEFALALIGARLVDLRLSASPGYIAATLPWTAQSNCSAIGDTFLESLLGVVRNENLLATTMVSLCGLGCHGHARALYDWVVNEENEFSRRYTDASDCYTFAKSVTYSEQTPFETAWQTAHKHMHRLTAAVHTIKQGGSIVSAEQEIILRNAVAKLINCCTEASQPNAGLYLARRVAKILRLSADSSSSLKETVGSFFGFDFGEEGNVPADSLARDPGSDTEFLSSTDGLLAATMKAYRSKKSHNDAIEMFFSKVHNDEGVNYNEMEEEKASFSTRWKQSTNEAIITLIDEGNIEDAKALAAEMDERCLAPTTFLVMAQTFAKLKNWNLVNKIYLTTTKVGCLTEELGILAMKSIVESKSGRKMQVLRDIIQELSRLSGMSTKEWLESHYWTLKHHLGWHHARLLMWWNNPDTSSENEVELALSQFERAKCLGLIQKNDVLKCMVRNVPYLILKHESKEETVAGGADDGEYTVWTRAEGLNLIDQALTESRRSGLADDPWFIEKAAKGLRLLGANKGCVDLVQDAVSRGVHVNRATFETVVDAAEEEDTLVLEQMLHLMESAGFKLNETDDA